MKIIPHIATLLILFARPQALEAATTTMQLTYNVFSNTAVNIYPSVNFGSGTPAQFAFEYDPATLPYFTGKVVTGSDGVPVMDQNGIVYDNGVPPTSSMSNESRYHIVGNVTLDIGGQVWTGTNFDLLIYNDYPTLTPIDGLLFEFNLTPTSPFVEPMHAVQLSFSSNSSPLNLVGNTALPERMADVNAAAVDSASFSLRPPGGGWVINSGELNEISITQVPEPTALGFVLATIGVGILRRRR